jgi:N-methylhydantoinase A
VRRRLDALPEPRERASGLARPSTAEVALPDGERVAARLVDAAALPAGTPLPGPALIEGYSSTTWVPPGWAATRDEAQNTLLRRAA